MNKIIKKIAAFTMAFTILGASTAIVKTVSPNSFTTFTVSAADCDYTSYTRPDGRCIGYGSRGDMVKWVQAALNCVRNANLVVDGIYGAKTKAAVKEFQQWANDHMREGYPKLAVDGIFGPCTWTVMEDCLDCDCH